jgi:hypothetical protein
MSLKSKLNIESKGTLAAVAFYIAAGIICFAILATIDFRLVHIGIIGILNLITAYGLLRKRAWTIWFIAMLFFIATVFSAVMLYSFFGSNLILDAGMVAYLILTWIVTAYTLTKRSTLES